MNYEQKVKIPFERDEILLNVFKEGKLSYLRGFGILAMMKTPKREIPFPPELGTKRTLSVPEGADMAFISVPSDEYFEKIIENQSNLEIAEFDVREIMKKIQPNTGLTVVQDKKGRNLFRINYRIEKDGEMTMKLLGIPTPYMDMLISDTKPSCTIKKEKFKVIIEKV